VPSRGRTPRARIGKGLRARVVRGATRDGCQRDRRRVSASVGILHDGPQDLGARPSLRAGTRSPRGRVAGGGSVGSGGGYSDFTASTSLTMAPLASPNSIEQRGS